MANRRRRLTGVVTRDKMDKTVVVAVEKAKRHPLYRKSFKRVVRYKAHDENSKCKLGDKVRIIETRPLSRQKQWRVVEIIIKGEIIEVKPQEIA